MVALACGNKEKPVNEVEALKLPAPVPVRNPPLSARFEKWKEVVLAINGFTNVAVIDQIEDWSNVAAKNEVCAVL